MSFPPTPQPLFACEPKPRLLPEYLEGRTPNKKTPFPFSKRIGRAQIRKARSVFYLVSAEALRGGRRGEIRAYDLVSSHHALRACDIIYFESRFELGIINA
ncbi:MAG: hypothetical protein A3G52_03980 [Candidatus Taylorbacteria bacterium RIFCSPLOWO2_12_FULL_43_20]|uniref:Uncharacterized protein n=1 Tax=Candidatus Taylorbacteria bacterium RIFCSPLOWO2_12_FULL_43_20 TaxID=1802332 RepID=A0A1G2P098_9BACT|nr:MAG: hypothetical protein A2825_00880 [Candidatus Taylorbacteria bacterium RIFCSPHIGHO2_01_FULL_43_120]OHA29998.1 MAG: hypothetical protein A3E92_04140 [Candidatus Taylorbacteria bacterium RIFCSPHIGHO2_12_FULL_42_34]OHA39108.1 MAG: hypothetical protein A3H58_00015 [Candidatus Taylorbacteria bacterium RIFCSPLOWO2_02_FULL_43_22b]OHA41776.1 MAG: hypothetical protein A3G52_03980 [Candidatus Taylorbacteria bacterium RIFCSPLOWO2_12_FULL_43_20]